MPRLRHIYGIVFFTALSLLAVLPSCNRALELPDVGGERKIALLAELVANDTMYARAGLSAPLKGSTSVQFGTVDNLSLYVEDGRGVKTVLTEYPDNESAALFTNPYSSSERIKPGTAYKLVATHPQLGAVEANVEVPAPFGAQVISLAHTKYLSDSVIEISLNISDPGDGPNYYSIEAVKQTMKVDGYFKYNGTWLNIPENYSLYNSLKATGNVEERFDTNYYRLYTRQLLYSTDANSEYAGVGSPTEPVRRVLLRDSRFNGTTYTTKFTIRRERLPEFGTYDKGRILLQVKSIPEVYYKYLRDYDEQTDNFSENLTRPVKATGNVINGVGMVGGVYRNEFVVHHDSWTF